MRLLNKILLALSIVACLTSCSKFYGSQNIIQNRETDYLKAKSTPPLRIPPGLSSSTITAHYPVSDTEYTGSNIPVNLTPPELNTAGK
jgi:uncharacterized lipoprotein